MNSGTTGTAMRGLSKDDLAARIARDIPRGSFVNLGIGLPTRISNHLTPDSGVMLHTENGMLGMGSEAHGDAADLDLVNAGKIPVTELPGASYFHHADSFAMMRGGHLDVCVLGAYQVSAQGDIANWHTGRSDDIPAVGGAMDLAIGAKETFVMMNLLSRDGIPKLVPKCTYPLTGVGCVSRVYTDLAMFLIADEGIAVRDMFGCTFDELADLLQVSLLDWTGEGDPASLDRSRRNSPTSRPNTERTVTYTRVKITRDDPRPNATTAAETPVRPPTEYSSGTGSWAAQSPASIRVRS